MDNFSMVELTGLVLFFIGIYGITARKNVVKSILSISIMEIGIILYFLGINFEVGQVPPVGDLTRGIPADPLPQALMITTIVIGVAVTAVSLSMFIAMYYRYGTMSWEVAKQNRLKDD